MKLVYHLGLSDFKSLRVYKKMIFIILSTILEQFDETTSLSNLKATYLNKLNHGRETTKFV